MKPFAPFSILLESSSFIIIANVVGICIYQKKRMNMCSYVIDRLAKMI